MFGREILGNIGYMGKLEWLVTNGIGGFASSTIIGMNTRRYHSVLTASMKPPTERINLVSRLEETLILESYEYPLSTNRYAKVLFPSGHLYLERFERDPLPTWTFQISDVLVTKTLFMVYGRNTTVVTYKIYSNGRNVSLKIRPHYVFRDFHGNMYENPGFVDNTALSEKGWSLQPFTNAPQLYMAWDKGIFVEEGYWYRDNFLVEEARRGLESSEDDYSNGYLNYTGTGGLLSVIFSDQPIEGINPIEMRKREEIRLETVASSMNSQDAFLRKLLLAADQFIVDRNSTGGKTIIAGYPWFSDWGRDSLISLPGLTLVTGRYNDARSILKTFAAYVKDGLVPNCFEDRGSEILYNSVDASLWFFFAVYKLLEYTDDYAFVQNHLFPAMKQIIEAFQNGTRFSIKMDPEDGLISAGEPGVQLTWMDAKINDWVVTPRHGKAVEINALWYNALKIFELLQEKFEGNSMEVGALARKVRLSFKRIFWNQEEKCLFDCVTTDGKTDDSFRPNQIFAVYLPYPLLSPPEEKQLVENVFKRLYTSMGLRSLSPHNQGYIGKFHGSRLERDSAYHQGTVWSYLLGPFISSYLKVFHYSMEAQLRASHMLDVFRAHMEGESCLGTISEVFDGNPPHFSGGCFAQAWSVAEILRSYVEDVKGQKPTFVV
ncbi:MAG: amylo-alpha-1,6-glucosidase [Candidatus Riflebacteria bacterium]|nr:amylo-alpha-1,6-glucosidase [Candidatus Riflebacteria bacterium]